MNFELQNNLQLVVFLSSYVEISVLNPRKIKVLIIIFDNFKLTKKEFMRNLISLY